MDGEGKHLATGMGRTLNVSQGGVLLELRTPVKPGEMLSIAIGFEENLVDVVGRVVHCERGENGLYSAGIQFDKIAAPAKAVLDSYLAAFESAQKPS